MRPSASPPAPPPVRPAGAARLRSSLRSRLLPAALLALLPLPAAAQDAAAYAEALRAFTLPGQAGAEFDRLDDAVVALIDAIEGEWGPAWIVAQGSPNLPADTFAETCERMPTVLSRTAPRSFEMRRENRESGAALAVRYDYVHRNSFHRSVEETALIEYLGFAGREDVPETVFLSAPRGEALVFHPSPEVLVIQAPRAEAEIYLRCP